MQGNVNPKIVGAAVIGFALIMGAYLFSGPARPVEDLQVSGQRAAVASAPARVAIDVTDEDGNGIEDWRDEFVTTDPIIRDQLATSTYVPPDTLTGELGINFFEDIVRARGYGPFGATDEEVIGNTVESLTQATAHDLYDTPDITILTEWTDQDIVNYANTLALTIVRNDLPELSEGELIYLNEMLTANDTSRLTELSSLAEAYKRNRDEALQIPVPAFLVKEHLDLINTFHAIHKDIDAMTLSLDDPAFALLRLKRYQDDATGLGYAMQNMFFALDDYAHFFTVEDPAGIFVLFSPDYQI